MKKIIVILFFILVYPAQSADFKVVTIQRDTFNLQKLSNGSEHFFVILFSWGWACFDCFNGIVRDLDSLAKRKNLDYIFVCSSDNSALTRRRQIETIQQFKKDARIYFDIPSDKNIFKRYRADVTPAILYINNSKTKFISLQDLAKNNYKYFDIFRKLIR
jgi:hypothetical protein